MPAPTGETVLTRRGLYMLPTRQGWLFAAVLLVLLLAAINYGNSLTYALTFLLAAVAVISMLITDRNLLHLRLRAGQGAPVFAGQAAAFRVHLLNPQARARYGVVLRQDRREVACVDVGAQASTTIELHVPTTRRGWVRLPTLSVLTRFPLGILYSWSRRFELDERCLVYPTPSAPWSWTSAAVAPEGANQRPSVGGDDFSGVREYRPGDSLGRIDWKSSARGRGLLTKEFASSLSLTLWLDLASVPAPDLEMRLSMLCRALLEAEASGAHYGLRLGAVAIQPNCGEAHQRQCLRELTLYGLRD